MELWLILFLAGLGLVGLELVLPMMFWMPLGLAAIATAPVSYFVDHWSVLGIWPILSMVLFIGIKKSFSGEEQQKYNSGVEGLVGMEGVLVEAIDNQQGTGKVKINADVWNVRSCEVEVPVGKKVRVVAVSGNQVDVEEIIDFHNKYKDKDKKKRCSPSQTPAIQFAENLSLGVHSPI